MEDERILIVRSALQVLDAGEIDFGKFFLAGTLDEEPNGRSR